MVGGFLAFFCLILLTAGMFWAIQGYVSYQKAVKEKPLAQAVEEARSEAQWVSLEQVPELYKKAVLAVEDHRYYTHHGIDWISMARAVVHDIRVMKPEQGGSTITQQLVKNMYYDQNKTLARKAAEAWTALYVERQLSKEEIVSHCTNALNIVNESALCACIVFSDASTSVFINYIGKGGVFKENIIDILQAFCNLYGEKTVFYYPI